MSTEETKPAKVVGRPFTKGVSGNPAGVPRAAVEIKELARKRAPEAFEKICELMRSDDQKIAFYACQEVLNRAYGKPAQAVTGEDGGPIEGRLTVNITFE